ncbi:thrombospondin type 3 repeat-containing protein [Luteolibacter arcticus]|uniref:Thrombospondin type 3 repeat-containing protein n=1 Tax=Luteolibacter arcticus TaxID=1581411 RepID=A0ABT3GRI0_9BACT|nr:thrombospondin type 3 repeat-containing protein [Luteolibacter arcticus]MCW1926102.1 thrombospondin type 3 repeat-containing protein [Luteolibacter arcticus]
MKNPMHGLLAGFLVITVPAHGAELAYESFDYSASVPLTTLAGGSGWWEAWFEDGAPVATGSDGLTYTDGFGNVLDVAGKCADTTGTATTRSLRDLSGGLLNDVWISFLWQLPTSNSKFEGVSFYRGLQQAFSISNPSTTTTSRILLTNNLFANTGSDTQKGLFGTTHFIVLRLTKGGGTGGADRIEAFIDPLFSGNPSSPDAVVNGTNFDFDRVRLAGSDGSPLLVDELRIGTSYADVSPHDAVPVADADGDGLSDAQEAVLGLDPNVSNAALVAAIQAHPDWFDLYNSAGILSLGNGGVVLAQTGNEPVNFVFEVQHSDNLNSWPVLETFNRQVVLPEGKNFLRVTLENR